MKIVQGIAIVVLVLVSLQNGAEGQQITAFANGALTFDSISNGQYRIEWASSLTDTNWRSDNPFALVVAEKESTTVPIPLYFRVNWLNPSPYSITGFVRYGGSPLSDVSETITVQGESTGSTIQTAPDQTSGAYNAYPLSNDTHHVSLTVDGYFEYNVTLLVENDNVTHHIDLEKPISPIQPADGYTTSDRDILLEWEVPPEANHSEITYQRTDLQFPHPIHIIWAWNTNTYLLQDLEPGEYQWAVSVNLSRSLTEPFTVEQIPLGKFTTSQSFTILE